MGRVGRHSAAIDHYVYERVRDFLARRHKVAGRGTRPVLLRCCLWRTRRAASRTPAPECTAVCLAVKPVGEPDAGDRHVRFDERGWETERCRHGPSYRAHPRLYRPRPPAMSALRTPAIPITCAPPSTKPINSLGILHGRLHQKAGNLNQHPYRKPNYAGEQCGHAAECNEPHKNFDDQVHALIPRLPLCPAPTRGVPRLRVANVNKSVNSAAKLSGGRDCGDPAEAGYGHYPRRHAAVDPELLPVIPAPAPPRRPPAGRTSACAADPAPAMTSSAARPRARTPPPRNARWSRPEPLVVMIGADRMVTDLADQPALLARFARRGFRGSKPRLGPTLGNEPAASIARGDQHDFDARVGAPPVGQRGILQMTRLSPGSSEQPRQQVEERRDQRRRPAA